MIIKQQAFLRRGFVDLPYQVVDTSLTSPNYFNITQFPEKIGGGKTLIKLRGNGENLRRFDETEIEVIDAAGNPVRAEVVPFTDRFGDYLVSLYVYPETAQGIATVTAVGVATLDLQGNPINIQTNDLGYNVIWSRSLTILPYERNDSEIVFDIPPTVTVAQIITPARISNALQSTGLYSMTTSSNATIITSNFKGFDKVNATNNGTDDNDLIKTKIQPDLRSTTATTVNTNIRQAHKDIVGGYQTENLNEYNTVMITSTPFFDSSYAGGLVEFFSQSYVLAPNILSGAGFAKVNPYTSLVTQTTQSLQSQLEAWSSTIVKVQNETTAYLQRPVQVSVDLAGPFGSTVTSNHTFHNVSAFTASLTYTANSSLTVTSSLISQSYMQFTFYGLKPAAGDVYKIRTYYKRSAATQDWTLLNDQIIEAPEYLTDATKTNQASYAKTATDFLLTGHFTSNTVLQDNWSLYNDTISGFDTATGSISSTVLEDSVRLQTATTYNRILSTKFYQNYINEQAYTIGTECVLDPYTELEFYMTSDPLSTTLIATDYQPKAYIRSTNKEKTRYTAEYGRYGKFIGKIVNNTNNRVPYGRVVFDFLTDFDGLGRPLIRCKPINTTNTGSAYVAKLSITPQKLNGFTPELVQYSIPAPPDFSYYLSESIDYKLEYFDYTGRQSEYVTYLRDVQLEFVSEIASNQCQAEQKRFDFTPQYWISASIGGSGNYLVSGRTLAQVTSESYSSDTRLYPMFVNGAVGNILGSFAGNEAGNTPVDGWNCAIPINDGLYGTTALNNTFRYISSSRAYVNMTAYKNAAGRVTSSWRWFDTFTNTFDAGAGLVTALTAFAYRTSSLSTIDNARFTTHSCVGITRTGASQSYADYATANGDTARTRALKSRRLVWPTSNTANPGYFTENGGIYNVKFKLKRTSNYTPDSGSYLMVYVFDAFANYTTSSIGTAGWYPPDRNIVKIGHNYTSGSVSTPSISWYDTATGFYYDEYDINVIQYGTPAQLVFEPSGINDQYFGTLVDDIEFCKVGVTTDPLFTKPQAIQNISLFSSTAFIPSKAATNTTAIPAKTTSVIKKR
jgi:hypothetical protein